MKSKPSPSPIITHISYISRGKHKRKPPQFYDTSQANVVYLVAPTLDPETYQAALSGPDTSHWRAKITDKLRSLILNKTWTIFELPPNKKAANCKWVFKHKYDAYGLIQCYKARLVSLGVAQGFS